MPLPPSFHARLVSARMLSPSVRELSFERVDGRPFSFESGQWLNLVLPLASGELRRAYSIASAPTSSPRFDLAVTHVAEGPGSGYLHGLDPGATLRAEGPQGFFTRPLPGAGPALFVATGTGVTPLRSMLHDAFSRGGDTPLHLLFGVRHEADILYEEEWRSVARDHPHVRVDITLSQPGPGWMGRRGYVQGHMRELYASLAATAGSPPPHVFICGLERMVGAVRAIARQEMGLARTLVHSERYD